MDRKTNTLKQLLLLLLLPSLASLYSCQPTEKETPSNTATSERIMWYKKPAEYFEETLVLGNGKMGASVFGGVNSDMIYLNDATLWSGEPVEPNMNPDAHKYIPAIREALFNENYKLADSLYRNVQGEFSESYAPLGTMYLKFDHASEPTSYHRELDLGEAISKVTYEVDGVKYTREYFISNPDKIMVIKLNSSKEGALDFAVNFDSQLKYKITAASKIMEVNGYAPYHAEPSYRGDMPNAVMFDENRGTRFTTSFELKSTDGEVSETDSSLVLKGGTEAIVYVSIATSFNGFDKNPATEGKDNKSLAENQLIKASSKSFDDLKSNHLSDYQKFYNRLTIDLGESEVTDLPTDERLLRYADGKDDKGLEELYFQYGRYLLIASSRTEGVPANLQGIWNPYMRPPWSSNYTTNINVEENYWMAETANLSEMHQPLLEFVENLAVTGNATAREFYGVERGWALAHNSDIWAMTNPVGDFGQGDPVWANWVMGGTWISTHMWEHYTFTQDIDFLKEHGYPALKGAAEFSLDWLVKDKEGKLVTAPGTSPENLYITSEGYTGATLYGSTADLAMIRECFEQTIKASEVLGVDEEFRAEMNQALAEMHPYQVGKKGNLQEWYYDWEDQDPKHRHQSQLFGLYPGHHISPDKTPELAAASRKTLEIKGDETTGWSKGWRINLWARLWDGNRAYKMYRELLNYVDPDQKETTRPRTGGTYPNLFDAHPPFQIDGNFGGSAAVLEMLVQSSEEEIRLLPALPDAWSTGSVSGVCARGGFEVSMTWENMKVTSLTLKSIKATKTKLIYGDQTKEVSLEAGQEMQVEL
ncbi:MAG: hypothetical protein CMO01_19135 [Thalassobius sp.]|nr:hypothetical protein [Thalassovita sp.]